MKTLFIFFLTINKKDCNNKLFSLKYFLVFLVINHISLGAATPNKRKASCKTIATLLTKAKRLAN